MFARTCRNIAKSGAIIALSFGNVQATAEVDTKQIKFADIFKQFQANPVIMGSRKPVKTEPAAEPLQLQGPAVPKRPEALANAEVGMPQKPLSREEQLAKKFPPGTPEDPRVYNFSGHKLYEGQVPYTIAFISKLPKEFEGKRMSEYLKSSKAAFARPTGPPPTARLRLPRPQHKRKDAARALKSPPRSFSRKPVKKGDQKIAQTSSFLQPGKIIAVNPGLSSGPVQFYQLKFLGHFNKNGRHLLFDKTVIMGGTPFRDTMVACKLEDIKPRAVCENDKNPNHGVDFTNIEFDQNDQMDFGKRTEFCFFSNNDGQQMKAGCKSPGHDLTGINEKTITELSSQYRF